MVEQSKQTSSALSRSNIRVNDVLLTSLIKTVGWIVSGLVIISFSLLGWIVNDFKQDFREFKIESRESLKNTIGAANDQTSGKLDKLEGKLDKVIGELHSVDIKLSKTETKMDGGFGGKSKRR